MALKIQFFDRRLGLVLRSFLISFKIHLISKQIKLHHGKFFHQIH